jgi:hypothetical protein
MSTSEPPEERVPLRVDAIWSDILDAGRTAPPGLPDPGVLSSMAKEFFTGLPGFNDRNWDSASGTAKLPSLPAGDQSAATLPDLAQFATPDALGVTEAGLRALPSTLSAPVQTLPAAIAGSPSGIPAIPGNLVSALSAASSFSFLEDARPLFAAVPASLPVSKSVTTGANSSDRTIGVLSQNIPTMPELLPSMPVDAPPFPAHGSG